MPALHAADYLDDEKVSAKTVEDSDDSFTHGLGEKEERRLKLGAWKSNLPPFWSESSLTPHSRTYSFSRNTDDELDPKAIATGGEIKFLSGMYKNMFRLGANYYLSHKIRYRDGDGTLLLGSNGSDISVLGQLYLEAAIKDARLKIYRQSFGLPYVNKHDSRMVPVTHEAYVLNRQGIDVDFVAGHVTQMKRRDAEGFISMAEAAGAENSGKGLSMAGFRYKFGAHSSAGAINYYTEDVINILYSEFSFTKRLTKEIGTRFSGQFTHQKSIGDELIGEFDTNHYGVQVRTSYRYAILTLAATNTGSGAAIQSPFGGRPGYLSSMLQNFDRANETGVGVRMSYDFTNFGLPALSSFAKISWGSNAEDASTGESLPDLTEYNFTVDFKPEWGLLNGFWLRARYANADFEGGEHQKDTRIILNYEIPFK